MGISTTTINLVNTWQIKSHAIKKISTLKNSAGKPTISPQEINQIVRNLYAQIYSLDKNPSQEAIDSFLNSIDLPQVNTEQTKTMDSPNTENELSTALNLMPGKHQVPMASLLSSISISSPF